jgi:hypothetical protein
VSGGGIANSGAATLLSVNSTVSGNTSNSGSGIFNGAGSTVELINTTIAFNESDGCCSGIHNDGDVDDVTLVNTLLAGNTPEDCTGDVTSLGNNLDSDGSCGVTTGNANLGALGGNGGPTFTHALLAGSAAINAASNAICTADSAPFDQRGSGFDRISDGACDIGAFEVQVAPPPPTDDEEEDEDFEDFSTATPTRTPMPTATITPVPTATPAPSGAVGAISPPATGDGGLR